MGCGVWQFAGGYGVLLFDGTVGRLLVFSFVLYLPWQVRDLSVGERGSLLLESYLVAGDY